MHVFVTGATGHVGSALLPDLLAAGHEVTGLTRLESGAAALKALGARVRTGDLDDLDGLREAAAEADGVVHLAFKHEAMRSGNYEGAIADDLAVVRALGDALAGSGKPLVGTSGTGASGVPGTPSTEDQVRTAGPRVEAENEVAGLVARGVRSSVVRLPPVVHSDLDHHGFVPTLIAAARRAGESGYLGDGANRWPAVHTRDAARVYRLALEKAPGGSRLHAVGDEGVPLRAIAEEIGRRLDVPVAAVAPEQAEARFGFLAGLVGLDIPASAARTRELLDWRPEHPDLLADLALDHYFAAGAATAAGE